MPLSVRFVTPQSHERVHNFHTDHKSAQESSTLRHLKGLIELPLGFKPGCAADDRQPANDRIW